MTFTAYINGEGQLEVTDENGKHVLRKTVKSAQKYHFVTRHEAQTAKGSNIFYTVHRSEKSAGKIESRWLPEGNQGKEGLAWYKRSRKEKFERKDHMEYTFKAWAPRYGGPRCWQSRNKETVLTVPVTVNAI